MTIAELSIAERLAGFDWARIAADLDEGGWAPLSCLLTRAECDALRTTIARLHVEGLREDIGVIAEAPFDELLAVVAELTGMDDVQSALAVAAIAPGHHQSVDG